MRAHIPQKSTEAWDSQQSEVVDRQTVTIKRKYYHDLSNMVIQIGGTGKRVNTRTIGLE